ncbi:MAG: hypothetical protein R3A52_08540 [Polyangiales bacterium]
MRPGLRTLAARTRSLASRHRFSLAVFAASSVAALRVGSLTPSDVDEGFYALAAELVAHGRVPYRDFFYPQAPYLPYLLAPIALVSPTLTAMRAALSLCVAATATVVAEGARRATRAWEAGLAAAALYLVNELTWQWGPSVRPYGLAGLLIVSAALLVSQEERPSPRRSLVAGLLVGVAAGTRLLLLPAIAAVILAAWVRGARWQRARAVALALLLAHVLWAPYGSQMSALRWAAPLGLAIAAVGPRFIERARRGVAASLGAAVALLPAALLYRAAPEGFVFGNLAFHANRVVPSWGAGQAPWWAQRETWVYGLAGLAPINHLSAFGVELALMAVLSLVALALSPARRVVAPLAAASSVLLAALVPMPVIEHYFTVAVPMLALTAGVGVGALLGDRPERSVAQRLALPLSLVAVCAVLGAPSFHRRWVRGLYGEFHLAAFRPRAVDAAAAWTRWALRRHPGPLLALWPGSALGASGAVIPGTENHFARAAQLPDDDALRRRLRVRSAAEVYGLVIRRVPSVVTFDREAEHLDPTRLRDVLERCGYEPVHEIEGVVIVYARKPGPDACAPEPQR